MARSGLTSLLTVTGLAIGLTALAALQLLIFQPVLPAAASGTAVIAILTLALAIGLRRPRIIAATELALLLLYILVLVGNSASSLAAASAPIVAGSLFLTAQLGWWAIELRTPAHEAASALWNRAGQIVASSLGAVVLAELTWQASRIHPGKGLGFLAIGLGAAMGVVVLYLLTTTHSKVSLATSVSRPAPQSKPKYTGLRRYQTAPHQRLRRALGRLMRPPDTHAPWHSHNSFAARTVVAISLLVLDAGFTVIAISSNVQYKFVDGVGYDTYSGQANAAPGLALGLIGASAITLAWFVLWLRSRVSPDGTPISSLPDDSPLTNSLGELEAIRMMCQRAWRSQRSEPELGRYLESLGRLLTNDSLARGDGDVPSSMSTTEIESTVAKLERIIDV